MNDFQTSLDIANRALDHCGQDPISLVQGFNESSKKARLALRVYDKLRKAELQRRPWSFCTVETILRSIDVNTMRLVPTVWSPATTYFVGSIVSSGGALWICNTRDNLNNEPQTTATWDQYFGPMSVSLYDSTVTYNSGELVYTTPGDGTYRVYQSRVANNADNPATATAWDATVTYFKDQVVTSVAIPYLSLLDFNLNQTPATSPLAWTAAFTGGIGSVKWLQIGGAEFPFGVAIEPIQTLYPLGAAPTRQSDTRKTYLYPAGYLRKTSGDPKAGSTSYLGASWGLAYLDWKFENHFIVTSQAGPIMLRFITDMIDVKRMTPMFCEGLAARMAVEMVEPLTQSTEKLKGISELYNHFMTEAGTIDAIDRGPDEFPVDDYIQCRI